MAVSAASPDELHPIHRMRQEFEIEGADGEVQTASNGRVGVTVYPDGRSRMRKRNAIKNAGTPQAYKVQWLYAELDGVRVYVRTEGENVSVIVTKQDLYP
ncbi:MAG: hypothetical protein ACE5JZ_06630 [Kiloniellales bacterium]